MARRTRERTILTAERDAQAARMRAQGRTYRQIAAVLGCSPSSAHSAVQRAIAAVPVDAVAELRAIECGRLDTVTARLWDVVNTDRPVVSGGRRFDDLPDAVPVVAALLGIVRVSESRRRLLGLDAPARQAVAVVTEDVVDAEIRRLEAQISEHPATASGASAPASG